MTSTAVVEIIDLTDNTQNTIPKSETREADADPEKNTTRAVRKRKNGEAGTTTSRVRSSGNPAESRHVSVERDRVQPGEGTESQRAEDTQGKDGESTRKKKRHSRKNKDKDKDKDSGPPSREDAQRDVLLALDDDRLFFVDTEPTSVPTGMAFVPNDDAEAAQSSSRTSEVDKVPLLLPAHVSVLDPGGDLPVQIVQPADSDSDTESYIEYLDYDDRLAPDMVRYFQAPAEEQKQARFVCKRCGAESEHRTNECPVLICLTCGARDEHSTRSCPISKTCFTCGMKGHINRNCPNRHSRTRGMANNYDDCDRCGSNEHQTNECPTIWRLYDYVTDPEREAILRHRESKQSFAFGQGGEGYIASDEWCYNCGNTGHLGDDCQELPRPHDAPSTPSAFGLYNILSGPFSDASIGPMRARGPRDWENDEAFFGDGWGASAPINVGKRARNKDRLRMEQRALELQEQERDDPADWFENSRNKRSNNNNNNHNRAGGSRNANANANARRDGGPRGRGRSRSRSPPGPGNGGSGGGRGGDGGGGGRGKKDAKVRLGRAWKSDDPPLMPPPPHRKPSLLERVSRNDDDDDDDVVVVDSRSHRHGQHSPSRGRDRGRNNQDRDRDREYGRDRGSRSRERSRDHDREWERDRDQNARGGGGGGSSGSRPDGDGIGFRIRGSASRVRSDASRHADSEVYYEREGRRREEAAESRNGNRRREDSRSRDRKHESRTSRDDDRGPGGPRYKGGYTR